LTFENRYTVLEQWLHRIGFSTGMIQTSVSDMEDRLYARQLNSVCAERPVFITALPRAGTTILLNLLTKTGEFATHTYRDMPFVLCPMLWQKFSGRFQHDDKPRERAHGDGVSISQQSPEAFEEIIWRLFWKDHYREDHIEPWSAGGNDEFLDFFVSHMEKIIAIRSGEGNEHKRYASKNNGNIARLGMLTKLFPDATIIIPFRAPLQHAASLLKQHQRFLAMHSEDRFSARYMEGIGHYDFGDNLKPINFDAWLAADRRPDAVHLGFWIEYWIAAYGHILNNAASPVYLVSFTDLTEQPRETLDRLADILQMKDSEILVNQCAELRTPRIHSIDTTGIEPQLLEQADAIYRAMVQRSISRPAAARC
jgi:hypothetical protein